ncbi:hypothetical protein GEMRC1_014009 [Eukaryota sp. GEM-RC1]
MSSFNDVLELKAELSGLIDNPPIDVTSVSTILASLDELEITTTILQETFIGRLIKQVFDVVEDPEIRQTANSLLQKWMRQVDKPLQLQPKPPRPTKNLKQRRSLLLVMPLETLLLETLPETKYSTFFTSSLLNECLSPVSCLLK